MQNPNIGLLFYKGYFRELFSNNDIDKILNSSDDSATLAPQVKKLNDRIINTPLPANQNQNPGRNFTLQTIYPGLLIGAGYNREAKLAKEEVKFGFHFDFSSGLPVIPGSSIKGAIRGVFPGRENCDEIKKIKYEEIGFQLKNILNSDKFSNEESIDKVEEEIFEGKRKGQSLSIYDRDIFYNAVPKKTLNPANRFLGTDYFTPHGEDPLKNPIPLQTLKILPKVVFQFSFDLKEGEILAADQKLVLIKNLILKVGLGAKTNVGYGNFTKNPEYERF